MYADVDCNREYGDDEGDDDRLTKSEQMFDFLHVSSLATKYYLTIELGFVLAPDEVCDT